jgi:tetratricopeptide (TPR) repeat protein
METQSFVIWVIVLGAIATFGITVMFRAYFGAGSVAVLFTDLISVAEPLPTLNEAAAIAFQQGSAAFQSSRYRQAGDRFQQAIQLDPTFAEAFHALGLTTANLKQDNEAARLFVKASELYLDQNNQPGFTRIKQDLQTLKDRNKVDS